MITGHFAGDKVTSSSQDAFSLYDKSRFGEKKNGKIEYSSVETVFLVREKKMEVFSGKKEIDEEELFRKLRKHDKKLETKLVVFSDLRKKGFIVKSALKFGAEFRVYEKGVKPEEGHALWILYTVKESENLNWHDFAAKSRVAHSTRKSLLVGMVDEENDVTYYETRWIKP